MKRKVEEKKQAESSLAAGHSTNSTTSKLIVELDKEKDEQQDRSMGVDLTSTSSRWSR